MVLTKNLFFESESWKKLLSVVQSMGFPYNQGESVRGSQSASQQ